MRDFDRFGRSLPVILASLSNEPFQGLEAVPQAGTLMRSNDGERVVTPYDDCVLVTPSTRRARPGVTVVRYARRVLVP